MSIYFVKTSTIVATPSDTNDGLDPIGFNLSVATFTNSSKTLTKTGAYSSYTFTSGDLVYISGGTGVTTGLYEIASKTDNNNIVLIADIGGTDPTDVTSSDGPFTTLQKGVDTVVAGDEVRVCADGTQSPTAKIDLDGTSGTQTNLITVKGASARGVDDDTIATISGASLPATTDLFNVPLTGGAIFYRWRSLRLTAATRHNFFIDKDAPHYFENTRIDNAGSAGIMTSASSTAVWLTDCEVDLNGADGLSSDASNRGGFRCFGCSVHDNTGWGVNNDLGMMLLFGTLIYDNGSGGVKHSSSSANYNHTHSLINCTIYGNNGDGLKLGSGVGMINLVNTIIASNSGYGINTTSGTIDQLSVLYNNCVWNNTSGELITSDNNYDSDAEFAAIGNGNISVDPKFVSTTDGSEDFALQSSSPCKAAGMHGVSPSGGTGYMDMGALQRQEPAGGGGGLLVNTGMHGGMNG